MKSNPKSQLFPELKFTVLDPDDPRSPAKVLDEVRRECGCHNEEAVVLEPCGEIQVTCAPEIAYAFANQEAHPIPDDVAAGELIMLNNMFLEPGEAPLNPRKLRFRINGVKRNRKSRLRAGDHLEVWLKR